MKEVAFKTVGSYVDARACVSVCLWARPSDPNNAKVAALVNTTSELRNGFMLIVSVSFIYVREAMWGDVHSSLPIIEVCLLLPGSPNK